VVIEYLSASGAKPQRRSVEPWRVLAHRGQWYLYGFDTAKKAERLFRVDRMTRVTQTERRFERPRSMARPGEELWPRAARAAPGQPVLRFSKRMAAIALERFPLESTRERDGSVKVELKGATHEWVISMALTYAGDVEVLSPPALKAAVKDAARRALGRYES
jgi:proteasome accessory factor B